MTKRRNNAITRKFVHASLWTALNSYCFFILNFIGQIFLAKLLIPQDYGLYAFALGIVEISLMFLGFSNTSGFINSEGKQADFDVCFKLNLISSALLLLIGLCGPLVALILHETLSHGFFFTLVCFSQCILLFAYVWMAPLQKSLDFKKVSWYNGLCSSLSLLIGVGAAKLHFSYWSLGIRDVLYYWFLWMMMRHLCPKRISKSFFHVNH